MYQKNNEIEVMVNQMINSLKSYFSPRIKESFLAKMIRKLISKDYSAIQYFNINTSFDEFMTGVTNHTALYEISRNIVSIHKSNTIGLKPEEIGQLQYSDKYANELAEQVVVQLSIRNYAGIFFRNRQMVAGEEFIFYPVAYKLFALCTKTSETLYKIKKDYYYPLFVNVINKSMAALSLIEDNFLDSAYPICRALLEVLIKLLVISDCPDAAKEHFEFLGYSIDKTVKTNKNDSFQQKFKNRKHNDCSTSEYLHYGWVDSLPNYHEVVKCRHYTFNALVDYYSSREDEKSQATLDAIKMLYNKCHEYAHGNVGNTSWPLISYMELTMMLYYVVVPTYQIMCNMYQEDMTINGVDVLGSVSKDVEKLVNCYNKMGDKEFLDRLIATVD